MSVLRLLLHNPERGRKHFAATLKPRKAELLLHNPERGRKLVLVEHGLVIVYYYYMTPKGDGNIVDSDDQRVVPELLLHDPERGRKRYFLCGPFFHVELLLHNPERGRKP